MNDLSAIIAETDRAMRAERDEAINDVARMLTGLPGDEGVVIFATFVAEVDAARERAFSTFLARIRSRLH